MKPPTVEGAAGVRLHVRECGNPTSGNELASDWLLMIIGPFERSRGERKCIMR